MARRIIAILFILIPMVLPAQTYTITEAELNQLETTIEAQQKLLSEQKIMLNDLQTELTAAKESLQRQSISYEEYERAARVMEKNLRDELLSKSNKLKGWQVASGFIGLGAFIGGAVLGWAVGPMPQP